MASFISLARPKISDLSSSSMLVSSNHSLLNPKAAPLTPYNISRSRTRSLCTTTISHNAESFEDSSHHHYTISDDIPYLLQQIHSLRARMCQAVKEKPIPREVLVEVCGVLGWNLFVKQGNQRVHNWSEDEKNVYSRVEMPGVETATSKVWLDADGRLHFFGLAEPEQFLDPRFGKVDAGRKFEFINSYQRTKIKYVINNGVMWIVVPKFEPRRFHLEITFRPLK